MGAFQVELRTKDYKDSIFGDIALNSDGVSEYESKLTELFVSYFLEISDYIEGLSDEKKMNFIAQQKKEFKKIWDKQTEYEKLFAYDKPPLSVEKWMEQRMEQRNIDKETAILKREKSVCIHNIHETKMACIRQSLMQLMALYRKHSNDLLTELNRFDFWVNIGYNDVPLDAKDIFGEQCTYLVWIEQLFEDYFKKLKNRIKVKNQPKEVEELINTEIATFNLTKKELSEKAEPFFDKTTKIKEAITSNEIDIDDNVDSLVLQIVLCECLYERQLRYIDQAIEKLVDMRAYYLPNSTINEEQPQSQPHQSKTKKTKEKPFVDYLLHPNKDALMETLHILFSDAKGKKVAFLIASLEKLFYLAGYRSKKNLYRSIRTEFGDFGSDQSVDDFLNTNKSKIQDNDLTNYLEILKNV